MRKFIVCVAIMMSSFTLTYAQNIKGTENLQQLWFGYFNQTRFSDKWGMWLDLHLRTKEDFVCNLSQSIVRLGLTYYLNDVTKFTVGYAYVTNFAGDDHKAISQPEHRGWQQIQWNTKYGKKGMMHNEYK